MFVSSFGSSPLNFFRFENLNMDPWDFCCSSVLKRYLKIRLLLFMRIMSTPSYHIFITSRRRPWWVMLKYSFLFFLCGMDDNISSTFQPIQVSNIIFILWLSSSCNAQYMLKFHLRQNSWTRLNDRSFSGTQWWIYYYFTHRINVCHSWINFHLGHKFHFFVVSETYLMDF